MVYVTGFLSFQGDMKVRINYNTATRQRQKILASQWREYKVK